MSQTAVEQRADGGIGLADAISQVREELEVAIAAGAGSKLAFRAESVELEFEVALERVVGGDAGVRVWVVSVGAKGELSRSQTHRVKLVLSPIDPSTGQNQVIHDEGEE